MSYVGKVSVFRFGHMKDSFIDQELTSKLAHSSINHQESKSPQSRLDQGRRPNDAFNQYRSGAVTSKVPGNDRSFFVLESFSRRRHLVQPPSKNEIPRPARSLYFLVHLFEDLTHSNFCYF